MLSLHVECLLFLALGTFENLTLKKQFSYTHWLAVSHLLPLPFFSTVKTKTKNHQMFIFVIDHPTFARITPDLDIRCISGKDLKGRL